VQLRRWGYDPVVCATGEEARAVLRAPDPPRIALLDRTMPGAGGIELCAEIRADVDLRSIYVMLLTAHDSRDDILAGLDGGADEYLTKPLDWEMLRARLKTAARIVALQRDLALRVAELQAALVNVKQLSGLLPMCSYCKRIRDDGDYWQQLETYLSHHSEAEFSHGICPACLEKVEKDFSG
jgi:sigma-B regulation protein RsbU (phosphoserine phosphatase)